MSKEFFGIQLVVGDELDLSLSGPWPIFSARSRYRRDVHLRNGWL